MVEPTTRPSTSPFASGHERTTSSRYSRVLKARREGPASERRFNPRHDACYPSLAPLPHQGLDLRGEGRRVAHARAQDDGRVRLISRNECDHTRRFPHLVEALTKLMPASFTLDGEVAVFDEELISRFEWLRHFEPRGPGDSPGLYGVRPTPAWREGLSAGTPQGPPEGPGEARQGPDPDPPRASALGQRHGGLGRGTTPGGSRDTWPRIRSRPT